MDTGNGHESSGYFLINVEPGKDFATVLSEVLGRVQGASCEQLPIDNLIRLRPREITTLKKFKDRVSGVAGIDPDKVCPPTPPGWRPPELKEGDTI